MRRFFVEQVKCNNEDRGVACGPVGGPICTSVKFKKNDEPSRWIELDEVDGMPIFYLSDEDMFDIHISMDISDDEIEAMEETHIKEFEGISLSTDYSDYYEQFSNDQETNPATKLLRYIILINKSSSEELENLIGLATGKFIDEVDIPISAEEQDYLAEL